MIMLIIHTVAGFIFLLTCVSVVVGLSYSVGHFVTKYVLHYTSPDSVDNVFLGFMFMILLLIIAQLSSITGEVLFGNH